MNDLRRHATTLLLVFFAFGLGVYVLRADHRPTTVEADARQRNLLAIFRRDDISLVRIEQLRSLGDARADAGPPTSPPFEPNTVVLTRGKDDEIYLDDERADTAAVRKLFTALEFATLERAIGKELDRRTMGLEDPALRVHIAMGRIAYDVAIGGPAPTPEGAVYGELKTQGIALGEWFVISHDFVDALMRPRDTYRDRTLIDFSLSDLSRIELHGNEGDRVLVRQPWGWGLETPPAMGGRILRIDRARADAILAAIGAFRADNFPREGSAADSATPAAAPAIPAADSAMPGAHAGSVLGVGKMRLVLGAKRGIERAFVVGGRCPGHSGSVVVEREGSASRVACVAEGILPPLLIDASGLVDRHLFSARSSEIESIVLAGAKGRWDLARSGIAWHLRSPDDRGLDAETGNALAGFLADAMGELLVDDPHDVPGSDGTGIRVSIVRTSLAEPNFGAHDPRSSATAGLDAGMSSVAAGEEAIEIGPAEPDGSALARRAEDGAWLKLPRAVVTGLEPSPLRVRSLDVLALEASQIVEMTVRALPGAGFQGSPSVRGFLASPPKVIERLSRARDESWQLVVPAGFATDGELAHDLVDALSRLHAVSWVAEKSDGTFGLDAPQTTVDVRWSSDAGVGSSRIEIGNETDGGVYARTREDGVVFVMDTELARTLRTLAIDRTLVPAPLPDGARIVLVRPNGRLAIDPIGSVAETDLRTRVEHATDGLHAEAAVHIGGPLREEGFDPGALEIVFEPANAGKESPGDSSIPKRLTLRFGGESVRTGRKVRYVRRSDVDATFVLSNAAFEALVAAGQ